MKNDHGANDRGCFILFDDLPQKQTVYCYGAGEYGVKALAALNRFRPDIKVQAFLDTFKKGGEIEGIPIININDFELPEEERLILITSCFWKEVICELDQRGIGSYQVLDNCELIYSVPFAEKVKTLIGKADQVEEIFSESSDRAFWRHIVNSMEYDARWVHDRKQHYLDHIELSEGGVVFDCGILDGITTMQFSQMVGRTGKVIGFDPFGDPFKDGFRATRHYIDNIEIAPYALWDKPAELYFHEETLLPDHYIKYITPGVSEDPLDDAQKITAISIDQFVADRQLSRLDYIKMDIEGSELKVLQGARQSLKKFRPFLAVSLYHKIEDYFEIPLFLKKLLEDYIFKLEKYTCWGWYEIVLYGLPAERYRGSK